MGAFYKYADKWRAAGEDPPRPDDRSATSTQRRSAHGSVFSEPSTLPWSLKTGFTRNDKDAQASEERWRKNELTNRDFAYTENSFQYAFPTILFFIFEDLAGGNHWKIPISALRPWQKRR